MQSSKNLKVGSDILYHCPRCNLKLAHKILAMVGSDPARVRCNTCSSERNYRRPTVKKILQTASSGAGKRKTHSSTELYEQRLQASLMKTPKDYNIKMNVEEGDVINHKKFGKGVVLKTIPPDRMEVIFRDETKVLVCKIG